MSLFRKPKKIQRRVFCADDDDNGDPEPPPPPVISHKKENKPLKSKTLLSFADEEEDGEVFKVKKSSQSKRLSKRREKEKKKEPENDNIIKDDIEDHEMPEARSPEKPKKKKVTLEGLILSGRAALAAGGSDAESSGDSGGEAEGGFHTYRADSVRAALRPGHIPDAALIHAARKTRQQARELGDFVPVRDNDKGGAGGGRLAREDDDDDDDEGRIHVRGLQLPSDKPERDTEAAEVESAGEEWEEQQLQKARPTLMDINGDTAFPLNPFSVPAPPPPPRMEGHLRPLAELQPKTAQELIDALKTRVQELSEERDIAARRVASVRERMAASIRVRDACNARQPQLQTAYTRAQAARGYFTDLVECLDEKLPALEALETRALALHRRRCEYLTERRRADVRDQAQDVLAMAARAGSTKPVDPEDKVRRTAEREGRRRARRLARSTAGTAAAAGDGHRDGDSSDDQLPPSETQYRRTERESIATEAAGVFGDVSAAWGSARGVCGAAAAWRRRTLYRDAYVADCLPRLLMPYVRHQLILWNPLSDEDDDDYEKMDWYRTLMMYGVKSDQATEDSESDESQDEEVTEVTETTVRQDQDLMLVPNILTKVVIPKLTELVEHAFDPMCVRSCVRLRQLLIRFTELPGAAQPLAKLSAAIRARIVLAINADVFLPTLPPQIVEGPGALFWRRCLGAGVRLLRGVLALTEPPLLRADNLALDVIDRLCTAAGAAPGGAAAWAASVLAQSVPRAAGLRTRALRRLAGLAAIAAQRLDHDNPLHMKPLEQVRTLLAEAKAYEV